MLDQKGQDRADAGHRRTPRGRHEMRNGKKKRDIRLPDRDLLYSTPKGEQEDRNIQ